jgi:hypothetical protein
MRWGVGGVIFVGNSSVGTLLWEVVRAQNDFSSPPVSGIPDFAKILGEINPYYGEIPFFDIIPDCSCDLRVFSCPIWEHLGSATRIFEKNEKKSNLKSRGRISNLRWSHFFPWVQFVSGIQWKMEKKKMESDFCTPQKMESFFFWEDLRNFWKSGIKKNDSIFWAVQKSDSIFFFPILYWITEANGSSEKNWLHWRFQLLPASLKFRFSRLFGKHASDRAQTLVNVDSSKLRNHSWHRGLTRTKKCFHTMGLSCRRFLRSPETRIRGVTKSHFAHSQIFFEIWQTSTPPLEDPKI